MSTAQERMEWARRHWSIGGSMCVWACKLCDYRGASSPNPVPWINEHLREAHGL